MRSYKNRSKELFSRNVILNALGNSANKRPNRYFARFYGIKRKSKRKKELLCIGFVSCIYTMGFTGEDKVVGIDYIDTLTGRERRIEMKEHEYLTLLSGDKIKGDVHGLWEHLTGNCQSSIVPHGLLDSGTSFGDLEYATLNRYNGMYSYSPKSLKVGIWRIGNQLLLESRLHGSSKKGAWIVLAEL